MSETIEIPTTVFHQSQFDEPVDAQLQLGTEELSVRNCDLHVEINLSEVFDVRVGPPPQAAGDVFDTTILTVGFDGSDRREVLFIDAAESTLENIAGLLFRRLLHGIEVAVNHPTKIGGRVTDKSFEIGKLLVAPGNVGCNGINNPFSIKLDGIVDFSCSSKTLLGEHRPVIDIQYVSHGTAVSLKLSLTPIRKLHLLGRFLRREYEATKSHIEEIDLPQPAFQALVKLYSVRGIANPQSLVRNSSVSITALVRGLLKADLVEMNDDQVALTPRGWILVTESVGNKH